MMVSACSRRCFLNCLGLWLPKPLLKWPKWPWHHYAAVYEVHRQTLLLFLFEQSAGMYPDAGGATDLEMKRA